MSSVVTADEWEFDSIPLNPTVLDLIYIPDFSVLWTLECCERPKDEWKVAN